MNREEILERLEGLDKRTKQAKELKDKLEEITTEETFEKETPEEDLNFYKVSQETYDILSSFNGKVPSERLKWLFDTYNKTFGTKFETCLCSGRVRRMIFKLKRTYEKERE